MKILRLEKLYVSLLIVIFGLIVLHAPLSVGLGTLLPDYGLLIKSWKEIIMLILVPIAVFIVIRRSLWHGLKKDWLSWLIVAYAGLHVILAIMGVNGRVAAAAGLMIDLRYILFFSLVYIAIKALPNYRLLFVKVGVTGAFIVVFFATLQLFLPPDFLVILGYGKDTIQPYLTVDKNPDFIRINSTLRGPNPLGAFATIVLGFVVAAWASGKVHIQNKKMIGLASILAICSVVALWASYSRSAWLAAVVTIGIVVIVSLRKYLTKRWWIGGFVVVGIIVGVLVGLRGSDFVSNIILHENPGRGNAVSSNEQHFNSLYEGLQRMLHQPFGAGVGSTGSASLFGNNSITIENQYLFIAHEVGWLGLALFLTLFILIFVCLWQRREDWLALGTFASGVGMALIGLLLPVWVDDTVAIIWWGLAAIVLAGGVYGQKSTKQKAKRTA